jgi:hypothetical protein
MELLYQESITEEGEEGKKGKETKVRTEEALIQDLPVQERKR